MAVISTIMSWYFRKRMSMIEHAVENAGDTQQKVLNRLINDAKHTEWGRTYDFKSIKTYNDFRNRVPMQDYETLKPFIDRVMKGEENVLWPGEIMWFAKSSGTTNDKSKFIPVSFETLEECHFQGGRDILTFYCANVPETQIFDGKGLLIGGSHKINSFNENSFYGDLSAVLMNNLPTWVNLLKTPDKSIALMDDWEEKLEKMANQTINENVTNISGVPTWTLVLLEKLMAMKGITNIHELWPNLELYIHGGVSFDPYRKPFKQLIKGSKMNYLETYNASEGFFGLQNDLSSNSLLLMPDYGIFYEFIKVNNLTTDNPETYLLSEVEIGENYAVIISNNSGLWRYQLGDTIRFTSVNPYKFTISEKASKRDYSYNVRQSKISIGAGRWVGNGFNNGTQTKAKLVPEQHTDFIFCTVGEEYGFVGSTLFVLVYLFFIGRLYYMAERQKNVFSRVYGYCTASVIFFHFFVNVGMALGVLPVIGIPLPFMSYGGSSLFSFSMMLFTFLKLDANRVNEISSVY